MGPWRLQPGSLKLQTACDPLAIVGVDHRRNIGVQFGVQRLGSVGGHLLLDPAPDLIRNRRSQVQVAESGAQVEARAPDHDRAPSLLHQFVDLAMRQLRETARR